MTQLLDSQSEHETTSSVVETEALGLRRRVFDRPLRSDILTRDGLLRLGETLGEAHQVALYHSRRASVYPRFEENARILEESYFRLSADAQRGTALAPGAEWILDNFHVVEQHVREIRKLLPHRYYRRLPVLQNTDLRNLPRVYVLALTFLSHTDGVVDAELISSFISGYQKAATLTIGELWAIPIMLRLALIENLRRLARLSLAAREMEDEVTRFLERYFADTERPATEVMLELADAIRRRGEESRLGSAFLIRALRASGPRAALALSWFEQWLSEQQVRSDDLLQQEAFQKAANQISIGNCFGALRTILRLDWQSWFESVSRVDRELRQDPAGIYTRSDFATRNRYREVIEALARELRKPEHEIAAAAVTFAARSDAPALAGDKARHVGYYLIDQGRTPFRRFLQAHSLLHLLALGFVPRVRMSLYILAIIVSSVLFGFSAMLWLPPSHAWLLVPLVALLASEVATAIVHAILTNLVPPKRLPRLDLARGVPSELQTAVTIHTIFRDREGIDRFLERVHVRYLGNQDDALIYIVLADLPEAASASLPEDEAILQHASRAVAALNDQYASRRPFMLLIRERRWNASEGCFLGWERKRGKVEEFNRLLLKHGDTSFRLLVGDLERIQRCRYVLTLDSDTTLPRDLARELVATIAHPLNAPEIDGRLRRVVRGYGIIQPRVGIQFESSLASRFSRLFAGDAGLDPYTHLISDVYQDTFEEGSYVGKGIYDPQVFQAVLGERVPENALLSHDLFEGNFLRVGLASDIELHDDFPRSFLPFTRRQHRWVRGDWQLLPWLFPSVPTAQGREPSPLSLLGAWKIFDNLRRSLVAPAALLFFVVGWLGLGLPPLLLGIMILASIGAPVYTHLATAMTSPPLGHAITGYVRGVGKDVIRNTLQALVAFVFLPYQACLLLHAIGVTLYRLLISRRNLLDWETAYQAEKRIGNTFQTFVQFMGPASALVLLIVGAGMLLQAPELSAAMAMLTPWFFAPFLAWWISAPRTVSSERLTAADERTLYPIAYQTWGFFRDLLNEESNYLIPDNIQLFPKRVVAYRTSPSNIGLSCLALTAAWDLGFCSASGVLPRLKQVLLGVAKLERYRGHLFNWYDTRTLQPLEPRYVSTVDSGNFVAHLVAVRVALDEILDGPLYPPQRERWFTQHAQSLDPTFALPAVRTLGDLLDWVSARGALRARLQTVGAPAAVEERLELLRDFGEDEVLAALLGPLAQLRAETTGKDAWAHFWGEPAPSLRKYVELLERVLHELALGTSEAMVVRREIQGALDTATALRSDLTWVQAECERHLQETDFRYLYNAERKLFTIGFHASDGRFDQSYYDLLASEARLASLLAIAKGEISQEHWFSLGRPLTRTVGGHALLSWSGTMFEYLMPILVMHDYQGTILHDTYRSVVEAQRAYAARQGVPWGISESGFAGVDFEHTYQYRAFGVPGLGLKRGLSEDLVVSPYSTIMALMVDPRAAMDNLPELDRYGLRGPYGYYEAIDFTPERISSEEKGHVVQSFLAHHQGMSLVAMSNVLNAGVHRRRFHADPRVRATELLLQERIPEGVAIAQPHQAELSLLERATRETSGEWCHVLSQPLQEIPQVSVLSNGTLSTVLDSAGGGYSLLPGGVTVTRWMEESQRSDYGFFTYVRDLDTGELWSTAYAPTFVAPESYDVMVSPDKAEVKRRDGDILLHTETTISPEDNVQIQRVTAYNLSHRRRNLQLTNFFEVVLGSQAGDRVHPAFAKLFVSSEHIAEQDALLFSRRARSRHEAPLFLLTRVTLPVCWDRLEFETSRERFLGRGRTVREPRGMDPGRVLSGTVGHVLDPVSALRTRLEIEPGASATLAWVTAIGRSREEAIFLGQLYSDEHAIRRAFEMAWSKSRIDLRAQQLAVADVHVAHQLARRICFTHSGARRGVVPTAQNRLTQSALWRFGISGDFPIVLVNVREAGGEKVARDLIRVHEYLRARQLAFDLVVLNEQQEGYQQNVQQELDQLVRTTVRPEAREGRGGVFLRSRTQLSAEEFRLLQAVARCSFRAEEPLTEQLARLDSRAELKAPLVRLRRAVESTKPRVEIPRPALNLEFENGVGGFVAEGSAYAMTVRSAELPPQPWINVIANPSFGFTISESGSGYTWSDNARENRLTPFSNDPVGDPPGEVIYLRDGASGAVWCPTPLPVRSSAPFVVEHRFGSSSFSTVQEGIRSVLRVSASVREPIKYWTLTLKNEGAEARSLEAYLYVEWVLGVLRAQSSAHVVTGFEARSGVLTAQNFYNNEFAGRVAFVGSSADIVGYTGDRMEFLGLQHSQHQPLAFAKPVTGARALALGTLASGAASVVLTGSVGVGLDPCGVLQVRCSLAPGAEQRIVFFLGEGKNNDEVQTLSQRARRLAHVDQECVAVHDYWRRITQSVQVCTPERSFDLLVNGWLLYQCLSARVFGRTGFYQSGGAYGFRDQLQDGLAFLYADPSICRDLIIRAAGRQFIDGDVQHWWHPPTGRGVRTRISDDYLWLPYVVDEYIRATGDAKILDEVQAFIEAPQLEPNQMDIYLEPRISKEQGSLYEHCVRAIERGLRFGSHGLPLIGAGDWNDGMNELGAEGKGESVWLAWFLGDVLARWKSIVADRGDSVRSRRFEQSLVDVRRAIEEQGWDGQWYRRAFADDGTPVGSAMSDECRIDSLAQSWAAISGLGDSERARTAFQSAVEKLVNHEARVVQLLDPPFDSGKVHPGYIRGYPPGVRENGGQYTHAAVWLVIAAARLGQNDLAMQLFQYLNPITHTSDLLGVRRYRGEPYVLCGDVYAVSPHMGRAGWSWYTGSAGWLYQAAVRELLGLNVEAGRFTVEPRLPKSWHVVALAVRLGEVEYRIQVRRDSTKAGTVEAPGLELHGRWIRRASVPRKEPYQILVWL